MAHFVIIVAGVAILGLILLAAILCDHLANKGEGPDLLDELLPAPDESPVPTYIDE
jgi:hypothetical protein